MKKNEKKENKIKNKEKESAETNWYSNGKKWRQSFQKKMCISMKKMTEDEETKNRKMMRNKNSVSEIFFLKNKRRNHNCLKLWNIWSFLSAVSRYG